MQEQKLKKELNALLIKINKDKQEIKRIIELEEELLHIDMSYEIEEILWED